MDGRELSPLERHVEFFAKAALAAKSDLALYARTAEDMPRVSTAAGGAAAVVLCSAGRLMVREMVEVSDPALVRLRDALGALTEALRAELEAAGGPVLPYYARD